MDINGWYTRKWWFSLRFWLRQLKHAENWRLFSMSRPLCWEYAPHWGFWDCHDEAMSSEYPLIKHYWLVVYDGFISGWKIPFSSWIYPSKMVIFPLKMVVSNHGLLCFQLMEQRPFSVAVLGNHHWYPINIPLNHYKIPLNHFKII